MRIDGACHCGNIAFEAEVDPETVRICHCTDCQTMSGSLFRANIQADGEYVPAGARHAENLHQNGGQREPSGRRRSVADCGTGLYATSPTNPTSYGLRVGTIAQRAMFRPAQQIWCQSELPWTSQVSRLARREGEWPGHEAGDAADERVIAPAAANGPVHDWRK